MTPELPELHPLLIQTDGATPASWDFQPATGAVIMVPEHDRDSIEKTPWADLLEKTLSRYPEAENPVFLSTPFGGRAAVVFVPETLTTFKALTLARKAVGPLLAERSAELNVISLVDDDASASVMAEALLAAVHADLFQLPRISGKAPEPLFRGFQKRRLQIRSGNGRRQQSGSMVNPFAGQLPDAGHLPGAC